jgi:hypothetical protein
MGTNYGDHLKLWYINRTVSQTELQYSIKYTIWVAVGVYRDGGSIHTNFGSIHTNRRSIHTYGGVHTQIAGVYTHMGEYTHR